MEPTTTLKDIVLVDLDGTLADLTHRLHLIRNENPDWLAFADAIMDDKPNEWCVRLINALLKEGLLVKIVSARQARYFLHTIEWLKTCGLNVNDINLQLILVRETNDSTPDVDIKKKWLLESGLKDRILFTVDDRSRVVSMWREEGLVCLQCQVWGEYRGGQAAPAT